MNKCPQCLNALSASAEVCPICRFSVAEDISKTQATKILSEKKMTPEKWQKIKGLFEAAQDILPNKRKRFLENACGGDGELIQEVEKLLGSFENSESFLENPAVAEAFSMFEEKKTLAANQTTGEISDGILSPERFWMNAIASSVFWEKAEWAKFIKRKT